jgi:hypothetical protein
MHSLLEACVAHREAKQVEFLKVPLQLFFLYVAAMRNDQDTDILKVAVGENFAAIFPRLLL